MLTEMLKNSKSLADLTKPEQHITMKLANTFQDSTEYLFLDPQELQQATQIGTKEQWQALLNMQETQSFIKAQMAALAQISQRKTFRSLVEMALSGNQQAAKQVQELSGVLNQQDTNRTIILHHIPRSEQNATNT